MITLLEKEYCYLIENFFPPSIVAGFTKNNLSLSIWERNLIEGLGFLHKHLKIAHLAQQHSVIVNFIDKEGIYTGDGLFTKEKNLILVVKTADCLPLFFFEEKRKIIGMVHLGWRSGLRGILEGLDIDFSLCKLMVGVGLRRCCFRVKEDFLHYRKFSPFIKKERDSLYFDPIMFLKEVSFSRGLKKKNFGDLNICSFCSQDKFFSYRRDKTQKRTLSFIVKL